MKKAFKNKKSAITPISMDSILNLYLAENVPSACAILVDEDTERKIGRSHLILESPSMGLLMRYVLERGYKLELEFTDTLNIRINKKEDDFNFMMLSDRRQEMQAEFSSGVIRSTMDGIMELYIEGGIFSSAEWKK